MAGTQFICMASTDVSTDTFFSFLFLHIIFGTLPSNSYCPAAVQTRVMNQKQAFARGTSFSSPLPKKEHACERAEVASAGDVGVVVWLQVWFVFGNQSFTCKFLLQKPRLEQFLAYHIRSNPVTFVRGRISEKTLS